jgi:hypothetical protein
MAKLKITYRVKGGQEVTSDSVIDKLNVPMHAKKIQDEGGFWTEDSFVPWASITHIGFEKSADDAKPVAAAPAAPPAPPAPKV